MARNQSNPITNKKTRDDLDDFFHEDTFKHLFILKIVLLLHKLISGEWNHYKS